jgi:hypothetical protein
MNVENNRRIGYIGNAGRGGDKLPSCLLLQAPGSLSALGGAIP